MYSTCSLNPIENEAVVYSAMRAMDCQKQGLRLLPLPELPAVRVRPGLTTWRVPNTDVQTAEVRRFIERKDADAAAYSSMLPPHGADSTNIGQNLTSDDKDIDLTLCGRLLPHDNDAGGFFLALFSRDADAVSSRKTAVLAGRTASSRENQLKLLETVKNLLLALSVRLWRGMRTA